MGKSKRKAFSARRLIWVLLPVGLVIGLWSQQQGDSQGIRRNPIFLGPPGSPAWYKVDPEAIPDYILWREFFDSVVRHGQFGNRSFTLFLGDQVGLQEADAIRVWEIAKMAEIWRHESRLEPPIRSRSGKRDEMAQLERAVRQCKKAYFALQDAVSPEVFAIVEDYLNDEFRYSFQALEEDSERERVIASIHLTFGRLTRQEVEAKPND